MKQDLQTVIDEVNELVRQGQTVGIFLFANNRCEVRWLEDQPELMGCISDEVNKGVVPVAYCFYDSMLRKPRQIRVKCLDDYPEGSPMHSEIQSMGRRLAKEVRFV